MDNTVYLVRKHMSIRQWFNDVFSPDISTKCEDILNLLSETHGCKVSTHIYISTLYLVNLLFSHLFLLKVVEVVILELHQLRTAHLVSVGSESLASITPHCHNGYVLMYLYNFT